MRLHPSSHLRLFSLPPALSLSLALPLARSLSLSPFFHLSLPLICVSSSKIYFTPKLISVILFRWWDVCQTKGLLEWIYLAFEIHTHTQTHTHTHTCMHIHAYTHTPPHPHTHTHTPTHSLKPGKRPSFNTIISVRACLCTTW